MQGWGESKIKCLCSGYSFLAPVNFDLSRWPSVNSLTICRMPVQQKQMASLPNCQFTKSSFQQIYLFILTIYYYLKLFKSYLLPNSVLNNVLFSLPHLLLLELDFEGQIEEEIKDHKNNRVIRMYSGIWRLLVILFKNIFFMSIL